MATLCQLVGFSYPAYKSFQAVETKVKGDDTQWKVYWIIFGLFRICEVFVDLVLYWIPFYYAFKLAFLLWLMLPQTKGVRVEAIRLYALCSARVQLSGATRICLKPAELTPRFYSILFFPLFACSSSSSRPRSSTTPS